MKHPNVYNNKSFHVHNELSDTAVGFTVHDELGGHNTVALLHPEVARALAADLLEAADRLAPKGECSTDEAVDVAVGPLSSDEVSQDDSPADKGKGSYVAFLMVDEYTGVEHLSPAVDCNGGVHRGAAVSSFEEALDAAELLVRGNPRVGQVEVLDLTVHRRGLVRSQIERVVA